MIIHPLYVYIIEILLVYSKKASKCAIVLKY